MAAVAQGPLYDKVIVDLPYPVTINHQRLEPGEYTIREMQSAAKTRVLQIFKDGGTTFETSAMTIPTLDNNTPEDTKVVLHKVGDNEYYFDKIWIQGKNYGYEFVLPEEVRNRQHESSTVAGRFVPMNQQTSTTSSTTTPADTAASRSTVNDSTTASNRTTTGTSTPGFAQSTENNRFTTSDSADAANRRTTSTDLTAQNRTTGSDAAQHATTPRSTASDAAAQQSTPRSTPRMTSSDAASQSTTTGANTAGENRSLSGRTPADADQATTTGSRTAGNTLPSTAGNWMALLLCGSALTSLGYAVSRRS
ncbi:MAG: hypothetical protein IT168_07285 [Bryobacterales bacterium]|nr:hypothetical protein [Bryobacterales bacterium]